MRHLLIATAAGLILAGGAVAEDKKGTTVELAGMKSTTPADWKQEEPSFAMRKAQFRLPRAEGDADDAELALFELSGSGTLKQNLDRQLAKFLEEGRKDKVDKVTVGGIEAAYQDVTGTFKKKKFQMAEQFTPMEGYRQLYVVFEKDGKQYYMTLVGPQKTVEGHKKGFEEWLKNFK